MTRKDVLHGIKKAEAQAEKILKEAGTRHERFRQDTETARSDIFSEAQAGTDSKIAAMEKDIERQLDRLRDENGVEGGKKAEAMRRDAKERMPGMVEELVGDFKQKVGSRGAR